MVLESPRATVLLYTDGLVERRGSISTRAWPASSSISASSRAAPGGALRRPAGRMLRGIPQDDVAIVAVRLAAAHHAEGQATPAHG